MSVRLVRRTRQVPRLGADPARDRARQRHAADVGGLEEALAVDEPGAASCQGGEVSWLNERIRRGCNIAHVKNLQPVSFWQAAQQSAAEASRGWWIHFHAPTCIFHS
jgi:hypothetical protein